MSISWSAVAKWAKRALDAYVAFREARKAGK